MEMRRKSLTGNCFRILPCVAFAGVMSLAVMHHRAAAADGSLPTPALYSQMESFHVPVCAGSIFGARLGLAAGEALKKAGGTGKFIARYYDLSCPAEDNWTAGDSDEHRLRLTAAGNNRVVEASLTDRAAELGRKSRDLVKKAAALPAGSEQRLQLELAVEEIHHWLKTAPTDEVVVIS